MKSAFTLTEILVAILVLAVGILGLASSATFIAIQAGEARAIGEGSVLAGRVLDSLRSIPCRTVASGLLTNRQATVRWTATPSSRSVTVDAVLELQGRRGARQWPISALLPCER
jgi:prepilin-type N-terminal cleavage/methylation domain-containing protein